MGRPRKNAVANAAETPSKVINTNEKIQKKEQPSPTGDTVLVAYSGVTAQAFDVPTAGGRTSRIIINGNNADLIGKLKGELYSGGFGITNVPRDAWEWISKTYKNWGPIKNGLMFASDADRVADAVKERKNLRNGMEPLNGAQITAGIAEGKE